MGHEREQTTMSNGCCLIAAVDLNEGSAGVVTRAAKLAGLCRADLVLLHVVDHHTGFESDHIPFVTPDELRSSMAHAAHAWLTELRRRLELPDAEIVVGAGRLPEVIVSVAVQRRARFVVTGPLKWGAIAALAGLGKDARLKAVGCDVLSVGADTGRLGRGVAQWLSRLSDRA